MQFIVFQSKPRCDICESYTETVRGGVCEACRCWLDFERKKVGII